MRTEKMLAVMEALRIIAPEEARKVVIGNKSEAAKRLQLTRMRKGEYYVYRVDAERMISVFGEIERVLREAREELQFEVLERKVGSP